MTTPRRAGGPTHRQPSTGSPGTGVPVRPLTAWALVALAGVLILFGFLEWIFPQFRTDFLGRFSVDTFTGTTVLVAPLLAVLVAARLGPPLPRATLVSLVALAEYAAALLFGVLAFLITITGRFAGLDTGIYAFGGALQEIGEILATVLRLGLLALAGLWTYQIFTSLGGRLPGPPTVDLG
jgi:hypothetical protein